MLYLTIKCMKPIILISIVTAYFFFSCKKEKAATNYTFPTTLKLVGITKNSDVLVYTSSGQITDANVINQFSYTRFFGALTESTVFNISLNANDYQTRYFGTIRFLSKDTLLMGSKQAAAVEWQDSVQKYSVIQKGQNLQFYSKN